MKTPAAISSQTGGRGGPALTLGLCLLALALIIPGQVQGDFSDEPSLASIGGKLETAESPSASIGGKLETNQVEVVIEGQELIIIRADRLDYDEDRDLTRFSGRVSLRRGLETVTADRAIWHNQTRTAEVTGSVRLEGPDFWMEAERAVVNMELSLAKVYQGRAFFNQGHYYLSGTVIERLSERKIELFEASATTCDGPAPPWTIQAKHLTVTEGGYARATGAVLKGVGSSVPLLASPYLILPVKTDRQSGFLNPYLANSSRDGRTFSLPFFWATAENHDLTFTPVWREERGLSSTLEGRYHQNWGRGIWQVSHLNDQSERSYRYRYYNSQGNPVDRNEKIDRRYWLRAQNQGQAGDWDLNLNLDLASDPYYLREFTSDPDGFEQSHGAFFSSFGHTLNEASNPNRASEFYAQKREGSTQTRAGLHYTQNLNSEGNRDTLQRLPSLQYDLVGRSLDGVSAFNGHSPRLSFNSRYDYFYRQTKEDSRITETGHRLMFQPTVDWTKPLGLTNFKMTGSLEMAAYVADGRRPLNKGQQFEHDRWYNNLTGSGEVELSTTIGRVFDGGPGKAVATRHQLTPTLAFKYVGAQENQGRLPYWDHHDRRLPSQTLRYGLSNTLVAKTTSQPANKAGEEPPAPVDSYYQFLKFGLWTSYEFADNSHLTGNNYDRFYDTDYFGQGPGPLEASLEAFFNPHISTRLLSTFNTRTGQALSHDLSLRLSDNRGDRLTITYDQAAPEAIHFLSDNTGSHQEIRADLGLKLNSEWSSRLFTRHDLKNNRTLESLAQLNYQAQCYGLSLVYSKTHNAHSLGMVIDLLGLGGINIYSVDQRVGEGFNRLFGS